MSQIIEAQSFSQYTERGSKFLGFLYPLVSVREFKLQLKEIRHKHLTSTHVCSAYRIISSKMIQEKGSDDGEPRGSAGMSILNELKRFNLINVGMFVVRYYGGTKLGISGLIHSYTESTKLAVSNCTLSHWEPKKTYILNHYYQDIESINFLIKKHNAKLLNRDFNLFVKSTIEISDSLIDSLNKTVDLFG